MMFIMTSHPIPLRSKPFNMEIWAPALESAGSVLNTPDHIVTVEKCNFRMADGGLDGGF
jgi:hypothetical protein